MELRGLLDMGSEKVGGVKMTLRFSILDKGPLSDQEIQMEE